MGSHLFPHLIKSFGIVGIVCRLKSPAFVVIRRQSSLRFSSRSWGLIQNTLKTQSHHLKLLAINFFPSPRAREKETLGTRLISNVVRRFLVAKLCTIIFFSHSQLIVY